MSDGGWPFSKIEKIAARTHMTRCGMDGCRMPRKIWEVCVCVLFWATLFCDIV